MLYMAPICVLFMFCQPTEINYVIINSLVKVLFSSVFSSQLNYWSCFVKKHWRSTIFVDLRHFKLSLCVALYHDLERAFDAMRSRRSRLQHAKVQMDSGETSTGFSFGKHFRCFVFNFRQLFSLYTVCDFWHLQMQDLYFWHLHMQDLSVGHNCR